MQEKASTTRTAILGFIALATAMGIGRFAFTPLLPMMRTEELLSVAAGGWLATVHFLGYTMGAFLARYLTASPGPALIASLTAIGVSTLGMGLTDSFPLWMLARWVAGVCSAFVLVLVSSYMVKRLAEARRPDLQGLVFAGVGAGIALVGLLTLGLMTGNAPSWLGWVVCGLVALGATAAIFWCGQESPEHMPPSAPGYSHLSGHLEWRIILPYGAMGMGYIIPATYLPLMAQEMVPSPLIFGWSWPIFGSAAVLSTVLVSRLTARMSDRYIWLISQNVMAVGLLLPALWTDLAAVIIGGICVGSTFMVITMTGIKEAHRVAGSRQVQVQVAAMTAAFAVGQMIGPAIAGVIYDVSGSFAYPLIMASGCLALTAVLLLSSPAKAPQI